MQPFSKHTGLVLPLDRVNVDTDQMVPKQFLKAQDKKGFGRVLFSDWRYLPGDKPNPEFILNWPRYKGASDLVSSRQLRMRLQPGTCAVGGGRLRFSRSDRPKLCRHFL